MADPFDLDPLYIAARRVLLDALFALEPQGKAVIVVGAQAVYLRTGLTDGAATIAPYTTDGDLALDPALLGDEPELAEPLNHPGGRGRRHPEPLRERVRGHGITETMLERVDRLRVVLDRRSSFAVQAHFELW